MVREFLEHLQLRHARTLIDSIDKKVSAVTKYNIFVGNLNVVLSGCLLIEILELIGANFEQLKIRSKAIRVKIENLVANYMSHVKGEAEMRFLLLEKDISNRDALELITNHNI